MSNVLREPDYLPRIKLITALHTFVLGLQWDVYIQCLYPMTIIINIIALFLFFIFVMCIYGKLVECTYQ